MPVDWIERTFQPVLTTPAAQLRLFPVWLLLGPRQVGKSSLLHKCARGHAYVNLDDLTTRERANRDPALFVRELRPPFTIDEIQYAPGLLSPIKQLVDAGDLAPGAVRLTGSQNFQVMEGVTETLAGRVAILNLLGLSDDEKRLPRVLPPDDYFRWLLETGFPKLHGIEDRATRDLYLSSYMQTYIERDIRELLRIEKRREFETFVKLCALRTGQIVNYHDLARDANVSPATVKDWLSVLEDGFLVKLLPPYFTNRTRRMTKSPSCTFWTPGWRLGSAAGGTPRKQGSARWAGRCSRRTYWPTSSSASVIVHGKSGSTSGAPEMVRKSTFSSRTTERPFPSRSSSALPDTRRSPRWKELPNRAGRTGR